MNNTGKFTYINNVSTIDVNENDDPEANKDRKNELNKLVEDPLAKSIKPSRFNLLTINYYRDGEWVYSDGGFN
jgi:hypothetical protein